MVRPESVSESVNPVLSEDYDPTGRVMKVRSLPAAIARQRRTFTAS